MIITYYCIQARYARRLFNFTPPADTFGTFLHLLEVKIKLIFISAQRKDLKAWQVSLNRQSRYVHRKMTINPNTAKDVEIVYDRRFYYKKRSP